ncbi:uncharacterized protein [Physcomitrium patens]|uniref:Uncharacterized protein n=1 Tax=Physcomitrium patens TaxID=3218 RepID=A9SRI7_PHYPA|nr:uncharacterized protein LOC112289809 [Physcomitrium patens]PNR44201.1 hypothetical protein PHYPA_016585 [Physcomitrium patens]|eukprot:XP_024391187.1 uncharacterized protein LOC112289809 [Physcomitrella patens]
MENQAPMENCVDLDNTPLLGNLKRSTALSAFSPKERQRMEAKLFKMSAPVPLRERPKNKGDVNRVNGANSGQVSTRSSVVYPERCMSPTDSLVSPITRGVLARSHKRMRLLNPWGPPKALDDVFKGALNPSSSPKPNA